MRNQSKWLNDLTFTHGGDVFHCTVRSGGVASIAEDGPRARPVNAHWWVRVGDESEVQAFPAGADDTNPADLKKRIVDWWAEQRKEEG